MDNMIQVFQAYSSRVKMVQMMQKKEKRKKGTDEKRPAAVKKLSRGHPC